MVYQEDSTQKKKKRKRNWKETTNTGSTICTASLKKGTKEIAKTR